MARTDAQLDRQIRRVEKRLARVQRKSPDKARITRLTRRRDRLVEIRAMPESERPQPLRLDAKLVRSALDVALLVLSATPAAPVAAGLKLGMQTVDGVAASIRKQDVGATIDGLAAAVRAELASRGLQLDEDDESLARLVDALEDQLDREA